MITKFGLRDAALIKTKALSNGAGTVVTDALDLGPVPALDGAGPNQTIYSHTTFRAIRDTDAYQIALDVPAVPHAVLDDGETLTVSIESSNQADFTGTVDVLATKTLTGAGGAGAAAPDALRVNPRMTENRYVRGKGILGAGAADGSALFIELSLEF
jgi:hypothetical protein